MAKRKQAKAAIPYFRRIVEDEYVQAQLREAARGCGDLHAGQPAGQQRSRRQEAVPVKALIVDSDQGRASLAAARALACGGWSVGIGAPSRVGLAMVSRAVQHRHVVPHHAAGEAAFLEAITRAVEAEGYEVIFGCSDAEILVLSRARHRLGGARFPYAPHQVIVDAHDKAQLRAAAARAGIANPPTAVSEAEALQQWGGGPAVVKEQLHVPQSGKLDHFATRAYSDENDVRRRVEEIRAAGGAPLIQPLLEGELLAFTSVVDADGRMLARVQQVAELTYPSDAGLSVRARTVSVDEGLAERVGRLLRDLGWFGLSELQFIMPAGAAPMLLDFNGRFYGSLSLSLAAGVNLPDLWARIATDREPQEAGDARPDVRYQWFEGDLRASREGTAGSLRIAAQAMGYRLGASPSVWSARDPVPGLLAVAKLFKLTARLAYKRYADPIA